MLAMTCERAEIEDGQHILNSVVAGALFMDGTQLSERSNYSCLKLNYTKSIYRQPCTTQSYRDYR